MKINDLRVEALMEAINRYNIKSDARIMYSSRRKVFEINWVSCGSQPVVAAKEMVNMLNKSIAIADALNNQRLEVVYEPDEEITESKDYERLVDDMTSLITKGEDMEIIKLLKLKKR